MELPSARVAPESAGREVGWTGTRPTLLDVVATVGDRRLVAAADLTVVGWPGLSVPAAAQVTVPANAPDGTAVGTVTAGGASVPVRTGART